MKLKLGTFNLFQFVEPPYAWYTKKEKFKAVALGPWKTKAGREYIDKKKKSEGLSHLLGLREKNKLKSEEEKEFSRNYSKATKADRQHKELKDAKKKAEAGAFKTKNSARISLATQARSVSIELADLRKERQELVDNETMREATRNRKIGIINGKIKRKASKFNEKFTKRTSP